ncbi:MAG: hypothetical protein ABIP41_04450 [Croceibacterium sp.]
MRTLTGLDYSLFLLLGGCHGGDGTKARGEAAVITNGPCDIRPLSKLSPSIFLSTLKTVKYLGDVKTDKARFQIYYYDDVDIQDSHENFRLIVFNADCKYLGLYVTDDNPVRIEGNKVIYHTRYPGNVVTFTGDKPPDHIWIDGDLPEFYSPDRERMMR